MAPTPPEASSHTDNSAEAGYSDGLTRVGSLYSLASQSSHYSECLEDLDDYYRAIPVDVFDTPLRPSTSTVPAMVPALPRKRRLADLDAASTPPLPPTKILRKTSSLTLNGSPQATGSNRPFCGSGVALGAEAPQHDARVEPVTPNSSANTLVTEPSSFLEPEVIAYSGLLFHFVERIPWGAQWEIARFVSAGVPYEEFQVGFLDRLKKLETNGKAAPEVAKFVSEQTSTRSRETAQKDAQKDAFASAFAKERSVKLPWDDLDKEEAILAKSPHGGLGCNEQENVLRDEPWYGGRVNFTAKVALRHGRYIQGRTPEFTLKLDRPELGSSHQFSRRFGSHRFVRVRLHKDILKGPPTKVADTEMELLRYFMRPFVIHDRVFRSFFAKEQTVFLFQTNEIYDGFAVVDPNTKPRSARGGVFLQPELSFAEFIDFHNPMESNTAQTMVKWAARFALGLSSSIPGARLSPPAIALVDDIVCDAHDGSGTVPNEQIMTDGCGLVRLDTLQEISERMGWPMVPIAIQMRFYGSKGLLLSHPQSLRIQDQPTSVWLRPSQVKIKRAVDGVVPSDTDPALLTIDIVRPSRLSSPARLSTETIINLSDNGVPTGTFVKLMQEGLIKKVDGLTTWDGEYGLYRLWMNVARAGGVVAQRLAREAAGAARAKGFVFIDSSDERSDDEDGFKAVNDALDEQSTAWWNDPVSGCPSSLEETVLVLLDAGFHPDTCPVLRAKLKEVIKKEINTYVKRYRIDVPMSCTAFIVPDPVGVLKPGEVHIKSSRRNLVDPDGKKTDIVLGGVLVTRHPCKVPTDVQKVKAVFHEKLCNYVDVIVVSTKDHQSGGHLLHRHLASCTGGGDYDGDTMEAFWHPDLVAAFHDADPRFLEEPVDVCNPASTTSKETKIFELQKYLLGSLRDVSMVGTYSTWWENSIYANGYRHPTTIYLAYMFCAILDGSKTGVVVAPERFETHRKTHARRGPRWKETADVREREERRPGHEPYMKRAPELGRFVMDDILNEVTKACGEQLKRVEDLFNRKGVEFDKDLVTPWEEARARAGRFASRGDTAMQGELDAIQTHVENVFHKWKTRVPDEVRSHSTEGKSGPKGKTGFTGLSIEKRQDKLREMSQLFHGGPAAPNAPEGEAGLLYFDQCSLRRVRASYAYVYDFRTSTGHWSRFPWDVTMRVLGEIKAGALGLSKTVTEEFYSRMTITSAFLHES